MEEERLILVVPKCVKKKALSGRSEFYNLMVTDKRIVSTKTGGTFFATRGLLGAAVQKMAKGRQDIDKFAGKEIDEIVGLDKNNWAVPFRGFDEIKLGKQIAGVHAIIRFKLNKDGKKCDTNSSVPQFLTFDKQYLNELRTTLADLAGNIVKT